MKRFLVASFVLAASAVAANAADLAAPIKARPPAWNWEGVYVGVHSGATWSSTKFSDPYGLSMYGDLVGVPGSLSGAQIGWNRMVAPGWVAGIEADASYVASDGSNTCLQFDADFIGSNCRVNTRAMGTVTGRLGVTAGAGDRTLLYAKGGLAWVRNHVALQGNNIDRGVAPQDATSLTYNQWGWTVGAGLEQALTPAWSLKFEYDYLRFADKDVTTPASVVINPADGSVVSAIARATSTIRQDDGAWTPGWAGPWRRRPIR